ncbi:helix-turn-helix domain-containing protein [Mycobacterium avium subsp. hominissuis]|uniref:helix-turn-helix domain-containing protein n=1 Tax=Mycobacterium avium TaxID=1764 RepID=UPI002665CF9E|nr:helix-turn-helix domain-containing protein [Mycobacterium avium]MDO2396062.1 helix-turn-helix domain-containing protein [Mycobacterium avium subsp. hominissuis]
MIANNPRLAAVGSEANQQRARQAGRTQAVLARIAVEALQAQRPSVHRDRWITALQHRISNPDAALAELGQTMTPPMTKHAYAALLRRALRGGGITTEDASDSSEGSRRG